jgi:hypothetical protein
MEVTGNSRNPFLEIVLKEILQFGGELDTSWSTSDNNLVDLISTPLKLHDNKPELQYVSPCEEDAPSPPASGP